MNLFRYQSEARPTLRGGDRFSSTPTNLAPASLFGIGRSERGKAVPSGVALMDAPNIRCVLATELGRAPYGDRDLDLKWLRTWHKRVLLIRKCHFVVRPDPVRRRIGLRDAVRRGSWRWVRCERARYGYNDDPVDDYIIHRLVELTEQFDTHQQNTISIISHDGGYAPYIERFVEAGGYVAILGILERMSKRLLEFADRERVVLFDLNEDVHAVRAFNLDAG
jgi:hypothetical protein